MLGNDFFDDFAHRYPVALEKLGRGVQLVLSQEAIFIAEVEGKGEGPICCDWQKQDCESVWESQDQGTQGSGCASGVDKVKWVRWDGGVHD